MSNSNVIFSYPRSGRHFVKRILSDCIKEKGISIHYAHTINDVKGGISKRIYIIRHPIYSIVSHWEYRPLDKSKRYIRKAISSGKSVNFPSSYGSKRGSSEKEFYKFVTNNIPRWANLYETKGVGSKYLLVKYHDLMLDTKETFCRILNHLEIDIDISIIQESIKNRQKIQAQGWSTKEPKHRPRVITDCPYYSREKFAPLWLKTNKWMEKNQIYLLPM